MHVHWLHRSECLMLKFTSPCTCYRMHVVSKENEHAQLDACFRITSLTKAAGQMISKVVSSHQCNGL
ncbi:hypothetical protein CMV_005330 [Castanea mollissima]|uniref:Uncharacterized protein n=1 Tax=Castanea mollissima TaxID=60419 RepID=A0A8J4RDY2_9ROSI|nr:hypothetical protein CMV_005330 [Castanea mollissima]